MLKGVQSGDNMTIKELTQQTNNIGKFKIGTRFKGDINGCLCEVVNISQGRDYKTKTTTIKDLKTGNTSLYGLQALERCYLTIIE